MSRSVRLWFVLVCSVLAVSVPAVAADLTRAKQLVQIGDYAQAVGLLHELAVKDPMNVEVRLLMARAFAACEVDLKMPGKVDVGQSNGDRALYQLRILAKLGEVGQKRLIGEISGGGNLALPAVRAAASARLEAAVPAISATLEKRHADTRFVSAAESALQRIGGSKAAKALRKQIGREKDPRRALRLAEAYLRSLDGAALVEFARTSKDEPILGRLASFCPDVPAAPLFALAGRTDLPARFRLMAIHGLRRAAKADDPEQRKLLATLCTDKSDEVRWLATQRLAAVAPDEAVKPVIAAMKEKDHSYTALQMVREMKGEALVDELAKVIEELSDKEKRKNWKVDRDAVFRALIAAGADRPTLTRIVRQMVRTDFEHAASPERLPLHAKLPDLPREHFVAVVKELLGDKELIVRGAAIRALRASSDVSDATSLELAKSVLNDKEAHIRRTAAHIILNVARRDKDATKDLILLLKSDESYIFASAIQILAKRREKAATKPMLKLFDNEDLAREVRDALTDFFAAVPDKAAVEPLLAELRREQPRVSVRRLAPAIKACAKGGLAAATANEIAKSLKSKCANVRVNAATALRVLGHKCVLDALVRAEPAATSPTERQTIRRAIDTLKKGK